MRLKLSGDSKVAPIVTPSGSVPIKNSFGLPAGKAYACPGATSACEEVCYAGKLERLRPSVKAALLHNYNLLVDATPGLMVDLIDEAIVEFKRQADRREAEKLFRIHWDGDFFSDAYVNAWWTVIKSHPDVRFWAYTRVESAIRALNGLDNLTIYYSGDRENVRTALSLKSEGYKVAMLAPTFNAARDLVGRAAMCPEVRGQIPLRQACVSCRICIKGDVDVLFSSSGK